MDSGFLKVGFYLVIALFMRFYYILALKETEYEDADGVHQSFCEILWTLALLVSKCSRPRHEA